MDLLYKIFDRIAGLIGALSCTAIVVMMMLTVVDVFLRKFFNSPILGSYEIMECLLMISVFTGVILAQKMKLHVKVTFFINFLPWRARCITHGILELVCSVILYFMGRAAVMQALFTYRGNWSTDVLHIPTYPLYWVMAVSLFLWGLLLIIDSIFYLKAAASKEKADVVLDWYT